MFNMILIAIGGAVGSVTRYSVGKFVLHYVSAGFPWGTLAVNILGSFLIGLCVHFLPRDTDLRFLVVTGFLGGFTTFSAFSIETMGLLKSPQPFYGVLYIALSLILSLAAVFIGAKIHV
jgi:CrcB protein